MTEFRYHHGFAWHSHEGCHVKGFLCIPGGQLLEGKELANWFSKAGSAGEFRSLLEGANGMFAVVLERGGSVWMAADRVRTFPLYYRVIGGAVHVSDSVEYLNRTGGDWTFNREAFSEFLAAGFVSGSHTLSAEVQQVEAAQMVEFSEGKILRQFYWTYQVATIKRKSFEPYLSDLDRVTGHMFARLEASLKGRTAVVALSGGFDSRFLAAMLVRSGYPDVICYSYGRAGNPDLEVARQVAERLQVKFIPVVYTEELIRDFEKEAGFTEYVEFTSNFTSMFFMQEYFAVKYLKEHSLVPDDAIFIPGHSADLFAGSQLIKHGLHGGKEGRGRTARRILDVKYRTCSVPQRPMLARIRESIREKAVVDGAIPYSVHEDWDLKEKISKFIVNSCNVYAWFGYEYRLPFFDLEFMEFFRGVPFRYKENKLLYDTFLKQGLFAEAGLNFTREIQPERWRQRRARLTRSIRKLLPRGLLPSRLPVADAIFYHEITARLQQDMEMRGRQIRICRNSHNSLLIRWYAAYLELKYPGHG
jgi:asparagine synthase (glutamine-hydrolysing)